MEKLQILQQLSFGERIAEEERDQLQEYFIATHSWQVVYNGSIDIVYGPKGVGKSAIYSIVESNKEELSKKNIFIVSAENPRGSTVFSNLTTDPPTSETEFKNLWKLYFLVIIDGLLSTKDISSSKINEIHKALQEAKLIQDNRKSVLASCLNYIRQWGKIESLQPGIVVNEVSGMPSGFNFKISFREPTFDEKKKGIVSIDYLYEILNDSLSEKAINIWILIDRLDVAFSDNLELETNALRALFKVYIDLNSFNNVSLKIFLRNDIWQRITTEGFREASHITKTITINWTRETLLNLIVSRILNNEVIVDYLEIDKQKVLADLEEQEKVFNRLFPAQVDQGQKKPNTLDWILSRVKDGQGIIAPREIIHLLNEAKAQQILKLQIGTNDMEAEIIIGKDAIKSALDIVSKVRLEQTIYAEYPSMKEYIEALRKEKAEHSIATLSKIWKLTTEETRGVASKLHQIGIFEVKGTKDNPRFWIPFLYRNELDIIQGSAD